MGRSPESPTFHHDEHSDVKFQFIANGGHLDFHLIDFPDRYKLIMVEMDGQWSEIMMGTQWNYVM